jgi:hypothetical protein
MQSLVEARRDWRWQLRTPREMHSPRTTAIDWRWDYPELLIWIDVSNTARLE